MAKRIKIKMQKTRSTGSVSYSYFHVAVDEFGKPDTKEVDKIKSFGWSEVQKTDNDVKNDIAKAKQEIKQHTIDTEVVSVKGIKGNEEIIKEIKEAKAKSNVKIPNSEELAEMRLKDMKVLAEQIGIKTDIFTLWKTKKQAIEYITNFKI